MCGFLSIYLKNNKFKNNIDIIKNNFEDFSFRGPDNSNFEEYLINDNKLFVGHHRLSIIDLDERSNQPMNSQDKRYKLIYNGEIYNHLDIRRELENQFNIKWIGTSDTETLLNLLIHCPIIESLNKLKGMFSFTFFDFKENKIIVSRDRSGEKPLYLSNTGNFIGFSSDIRAFRHLIDFKNSINQLAFINYLKYNYVPNPLSIINNIFKLPPGSYMEVNLNKINYENSLTFEELCEKNFIKFKYYWKIENNFNKNKDYKNIYNISNNIDNLIEKSVKSQLLSDVPVGAFLSGGNDSSLIVANMQKFQKTNTFTIGFNESEHDESKSASEIAKILKTNHTSLICSNKEAIDVITSINSAFSEPFADSSQIPTMLVSNLASKHVKVALSGDGGDEIFGGYNRYLIASKYWKFINFFNYKDYNLLFKMITYTPSSIINIFLNRYLQNYTISKKNLQIEMIKNKIKNIKNEETFYESLINQYFSDKNYKSNNYKYNKYTNDFIKNMMISDFNSYLPDDILCKVDRSSMYYSLELRSPFLDKDLIHYAVNIPSIYNVHRGKSKILIKSILEKYLPKNLIYKKKKGFSVPISDWLKNELKPWAESLLTKDIIESHNLINYSFVNQIKEDHFNNLKNNEHKLWSLIQFNSWYKSL